MAKKKKKGKKKEKSVNHIVTPFITRVPGYRNELKKKKKNQIAGQARWWGEIPGVVCYFSKIYYRNRCARRQGERRWTALVVYHRRDDDQVFPFFKSTFSLVYFIFFSGGSNLRSASQLDVGKKIKNRPLLLCRKKKKIKIFCVVVVRLPLLLKDALKMDLFVGSV